MLVPQANGGPAQILALTYTIGMSPRVRVALALLGLLVICVSLAILAYAFGTSDHITEQVPVAPTLFVPPPS